MLHSLCAIAHNVNNNSKQGESQLSRLAVRLSVVPGDWKGQAGGRSGIEVGYADDRVGFGAFLLGWQMRINHLMSPPS